MSGGQGLGLWGPACWASTLGCGPVLAGSLPPVMERTPDDGVAGGRTCTSVCFPSNNVLAVYGADTRKGLVKSALASLDSLSSSSFLG